MGDPCSSRDWRLPATCSTRDGEIYDVFTAEPHCSSRGNFSRLPVPTRFNSFGQYVSFKRLPRGTSSLHRLRRYRHAEFNARSPWNAGDVNRQARVLLEHLNDLDADRISRLLSRPS